MTISLSLITVALVFALIGALITYFVGVIRKVMSQKNLENTRALAKQAIEEAKEKAEVIKREAQLEVKDLQLRMRQDFEKETHNRKLELSQIEKRMTQKEENLERRLDLLDRKENDMGQRLKTITQKEESIKNKETHLEQLLVEEKEKLQKISSMTPEEAKILLLSRLEQELNQEKAILIKRAEEEIKELADKKSKQILSLAIQKCAVEHTVETTVSVVSLPNEEMKGRIIGREGRNIRAFEMATGVDVIIDDTPEAVTLSSFDVVRREIARMSLERLMTDGRIHPGRIEEIVEKAKKDMEERSKRRQIKSSLMLACTIYTQS